MTAPMTMTITSDSGTFTYTLGADFEERHVASNVANAEKKAQDLYDPWHENPHRAAVTVIIRGSLTPVTQGVDLKPKFGYHWSLRLDDLTAVMMGPSGRAGGNGDPGQLDRNVDSVIVSGYNDTGNRKITHVAASQ